MRFPSDIALSQFSQGAGFSGVFDEAMGEQVLRCGTRPRIFGETEGDKVFEGVAEVGPVEGRRFGFRYKKQDAHGMMLGQRWFPLG